MVLLSKDTTVSEMEIHDGIKGRMSWVPSVVEDSQRGYLGMSGLGDPCVRKTWLSWRWYSTATFSARSKRIFERGDWEEPRIIRDLKAAGIECFRRDSNGNRHDITGITGEEQEEFVGFAGHSKGHPDGRALGVIEAPSTEHLLEFKTANQKNFDQFVKLGVRAWKPTYFGQVQKYMHHAKLTRCLFIVTNKNTEERAIERIKIDPSYIKDINGIEQDILMSDTPPEKEFSRTWHACKWCSHSDFCHKGAEPVRTCRSCVGLDLYDGGVFKCGNELSSNCGKVLTLEDQRSACRAYRVIKE